MDAFWVRTRPSQLLTPLHDYFAIFSHISFDSCSSNFPSLISLLYSTSNPLLSSSLPPCTLLPGDSQFILFIVQSLYLPAPACHISVINSATPRLTWPIGRRVSLLTSSVSLPSPRSSRRLDYISSFPLVILVSVSPLGSLYCISSVNFSCVTRPSSVITRR